MVNLVFNIKSSVCCRLINILLPNIYSCPFPYNQSGINIPTIAYN
uniref:Uncharacterized protein n=1 Tax=Rhizophora mucronata TaxID=61149 RepID=A0A2P2Q657_RHIMU